VGYVGHERINKAAVMALPKPLLVFFYNHIDFVTQESTVICGNMLLQTKNEAQNTISIWRTLSVDSFPQNMAETKKKYDDKFLSKTAMVHSRNDGKINYSI
jgi:hypothetical protein